MNAMPTRPMAYTVAVSSHQKASGDAAWSTPTTTPHIAGVRIDGLAGARAYPASGTMVEVCKSWAGRHRTGRLSPVRENGFDVAVVGASIAGCTAATLFARAGARVALIESHADPDGYKRACTHMIQSSANGVLDRLGVADELERLGGVRTAVE